MLQVVAHAITAILSYSRALFHTCTHHQVHLYCLPLQAYPVTWYLLCTALVLTGLNWYMCSAALLQGSLSLGAHGTRQLLLRVVGRTGETVTGGLHMVEQSTISASCTPWDALWILVDTLNGVSIVV